MKGTVGLLAIAVLTGGCVTTKDDASLRISNLKQGLARVESQDSGTIYSEGTNFRVARNGDCVAVGKMVPCMWFAFAFDYEAKSEVTTLACSTVFSEPVEVVDPSESHGKAREFSAPITLKGKKGKVFWPGYITIDDEKGPDRLTTVCQFEDREVLRVSFAFLQ